MCMKFRNSFGESLQFEFFDVKVLIVHEFHVYEILNWRLAIIFKKDF